MKELLFIIFAGGAILSGLLVITSNNPIHSVLSLVLGFANISILLILLGVEFLGLLFLIVYVGAIAILFLFVVMMLNIKLVELLDNATRYVPIGSIIGVIFFIEISILFDHIFLLPSSLITLSSIITWEGISPLSNITAIGIWIYTEGYIYFIVASLILLVAMIAAIVLTLTHGEEVKRQDIFTQIATNSQETIFLAHESNN